MMHTTLRPVFILIIVIFLGVPAGGAVSGKTLASDTPSTARGVSPSDQGGVGEAPITGNPATTTTARSPRGGGRFEAGAEEETETPAPINEDAPAPDKPQEVSVPATAGNDREDRPSAAAPAGRTRTPDRARPGFRDAAGRRLPKPKSTTTTAEAAEQEANDRPPMHTDDEPGRKKLVPRTPRAKNPVSKTAVGTRPRNPLPPVLDPETIPDPDIPLAPDDDDPGAAATDAPEASAADGSLQAGPAENPADKTVRQKVPDCLLEQLLGPERQDDIAAYRLYRLKRLMGSSEGLELAESYDRNEAELRTFFAHNSKLSAAAQGLLRVFSARFKANINGTQTIKIFEREQQQLLNLLHVVRKAASPKLQSGIDLLLRHLNNPSGMRRLWLQLKPEPGNTAAPWRLSGK